MIENPYSQEGHGPYELHDIGDLGLEVGGTIRCCRLAVATHGKLNAAKDNAILVPTWYSGTSKIIEQVSIGKGRALDPDKYFIVVVNQIGMDSRAHRITRRHPTGWRTSRKYASATTCEAGCIGPTLGEFIDNFMAGYFAPLDPNDLLAMAWKWQRGDVSRMTGSAMAVCAVRGIARAVSRRE